MPLARPLVTLRLGLTGLTLHKLRSTLTVIGIVFGVGSVIVMLAVGEGARYEAVQQIKDLGATNIIVRSVKPTEDTRENKNSGMLQYGLTSDDLGRIVSTIPTVVSATPLREFFKELRFLDRKLEGRVVGVMPNYAEMNGLKVRQGRFIEELDGSRFANVCVLGAETAETLFPFEDPVGRSIHITAVGGGQVFEVIGVTERRAQSAGIGSSLSAQDYNRDVYVPFQTDRVRFGKIITYQRAGTWQSEKLEISQITITVDEMNHVRKTAQIIEGLLEEYHKQKDTSVTVPLDLLEKAEATQRIFTLVLGAIASISLVVGGIGIMNIMLATVTERTREIGIRRALGARQRDITWQFLVETIGLSSIGGVLGLCLGIGLAYLVTHFFELRTIIRPWSPILAFAISVGVGLIFGIYPARRAALMDPVEALRHE